MSSRLILGWAGLLLFWASIALGAGEIEGDPRLVSIFEEHKVQGTFVLLDVKTGQLKGHDRARASKRFIPASTFKIPNTIIGLETAAVKSVDEVLPYGGKPQPFPDWERDMSLRDALRISAVPIYKELARRIGLTRMNEWVTRLDYGNANIGNVVDQFWLSGPLEISAVEQTRFLARLVKKELPIRSETYDAVNAITVVQKVDNYTLHGKSGWGMSTNPQIGWWVGWVERDGIPIVTFALNIDVADNADAAKRLPIVKACLQKLGALPPGGG